MTRTRKLAATLAITLTATLALFVAPVSGDRPLVRASAHTVYAESICGAFFDGKRSFVTVTNGHLNWYTSHSRSGTRYRVTYAARSMVQPHLPMHVHTVTCYAP